MSASKPTNLGKLSDVLVHDHRLRDLKKLKQTTRTFTLSVTYNTRCATDAFIKF